MIDYDSAIKNLLKEKEEAENKVSPWKSDLIKNDKGKVVNCIENYLLYFTQCDKYKGKLWYNEYLRQFEFDGGEWDDLKEARACNDIEYELGLTGVGKVHNALMQIFDTHKYDPVKDYLNGLKWDGKERIDTLFIDLLQADDTELNRMMTRKWFTAAVKRAVIPGCKFDNILILKGAQGVGKSTICEKLSRGFYSTVSLDEISNKDIIDKMNKSWICIIDELDTFSKKEMTTVKTFLSTSIDTARLAYGKYTKQYKRHCIFIGSTNEDTFLRDSTSSIERRFWIIDCKREKYDPIVNTTMTPEYVDQLWAEAYHCLKQDMDQYLDIEADHIEEFGTVQKDFKKYNDDVVIDYINNILNKEYILVDGRFNDDNDFLNQYTNNKVYENNNKTNINKITISSLLYVLKKVYGETRPSKYIGTALSDEWKYSTVRNYNGKPERGLIRIKPIGYVENELFEDNNL